MLLPAPVVAQNTAAAGPTSSDAGPTSSDAGGFHGWQLEGLPNEPWDGGDPTMSAGWVVIDSGDASDLEVDLDSDEGETVQ